MSTESLKRLGYVCRRETTTGLVGLQKPRPVFHVRDWSGKLVARGATAREAWDMARRYVIIERAVGVYQ